MSERKRLAVIKRIDIQESVLTRDQAVEYMLKAKTAFEEGKVPILSLEMVREIDPQAVGVFSLLAVSYRSHLIPVVASPELAESIVDSGFGGAFQTFGTMDEVRMFLDQQQEEAVARDFFLNSQQILGGAFPFGAEKLMFGPITSNQQHPLPKLDELAIASACLGGTCFTVLLAMKVESFLAIMSKTIGRRYSRIEPEIADGAAELLNTIMGLSLSSYGPKYPRSSMSIPVAVKSDSDEGVKFLAKHLNYSRIEIEGVEFYLGFITKDR